MLSTKSYLQISGWIFAVVAIAHLLRLFTGWSVVLNGFVLPLWVSLLGVALAGCLSYNSFNLSKKVK